MSKKRFTRYTCDVLACRERTEVEDRNGCSDPPLLWGFIKIDRLRSNTNVGMWLCAEHMKVIDRWKYEIPNLTVEGP